MKMGNFSLELSEHNANKDGFIVVAPLKSAVSSDTIIIKDKNIISAFQNSHSSLPTLKIHS